MFKLIQKNNWLAGAMIFFMPVALIFFLGSQMAYSQVKNKFELYQSIPQVTRLSDLETVPAGQVVLLRGRIARATALENSADTEGELIIFQERPAAGREVRYQEEFPLVFPEFVMNLPDGRLNILPSQSRERVIQHELHRVQRGDRDYTGFAPGDMVTVQGQWQPAAGAIARLNDVTGITGADKQSLLREWELAFRQVSWVRNGLGLFTALSIVLLIIQLRRTRLNRNANEEATWPNQETKRVPTV